MSRAEDLSKTVVTSTDLASTSPGKGTAMVGDLDQRIFKKVDLPAVLGSQLGIGYRMSYNGADARYLGGMWPATNYCAWLFEAKFTATNTPGVGESPASTAFFYAENDGSGKDVLAGMFVTYLKTATGAGFSTNHIVTGDIGLSNGKYVISEFDFQPASGATVNSNSVGMPINAFNAAAPVCIQIGGVGGGSWGNGIVFYNVTGACLAGGAGATLGSLFNTGAATYTGAAGIFSNGHALQFSGTASSHFTLRSDGSNNLRLKLGGGAFVVRDVNDVSSLAAIGSDGSASFGVNASIAAGYKVDTAADVGGEGLGLFRGRSANGNTSIEVYSSLGTVGNAAACTLRLRSNSVTSRSINAGGTINAAGADYAEYERLANGVSSFAKGDVVGFDSDGLLTDRFESAIRFGVKSTNPSLVGGDDWESDVPLNPEKPTFIPTPYDGTLDPGPMAPKSEYPTEYTNLREVLINKRRELDVINKDSDAFQLLSKELESVAKRVQELRDLKDVEDEMLFSSYQSQKAQFEIDSKNYAQRVAAEQVVWTNTVLAEWQEAVNKLEDQRAIVRSGVERIAYCGKVPVNVIGAKPGQHLIPSPTSSGGISAIAVNSDTLSFHQSIISLGIVNRVLSDGRAEIVIRVG